MESIKRELHGLGMASLKNENLKKIDQMLVEFNEPSDFDF
jgi:hypothetical protein